MMPQRQGGPEDADMDGVKYLAIARELRAEVEALAPGEPAPSVRAIAQRYDVAPNTAQRALSVLVDWGLVTVERRKTSVRAATTSSGGERVARLRAGQPLHRPGESVTVLGAAMMTVVPEHVAVALGLEEGESAVYRAITVTNPQGTIVTYGQSWMPGSFHDACPELSVREVIEQGNIGLIEQRLGLVTVTPLSVDYYAAPGSVEEVTALGLSYGTYVLREVTHCKTADGRTLEYNESAHPAEYRVCSRQEM